MHKIHSINTTRSYPGVPYILAILFCYRLDCTLHLGYQSQTVFFFAIVSSTKVSIGLQNTTQCFAKDCNIHFATSPWTVFGIAYCFLYTLLLNISTDLQYL